MLTFGFTQDTDYRRLLVMVSLSHPSTQNASRYTDFVALYDFLLCATQLFQKWQINKSNVRFCLPKHLRGTSSITASHWWIRSVRCKWKSFYAAAKYMSVLIPNCRCLLLITFTWYVASSLNYTHKSMYSLKVETLSCEGGGLLRTCVLRPCGIYGPDERRHLHRVMVRESAYTLSCDQG